MPSARSHDGGCLCGAIRYRVDGEPIDTSVCYCRQCQRQTGAPVPAFATYALGRFRLLAGTPARYRASDTATRQFCARCGSSLFWQRDNSDELDVFLGTLDDATAMPAPADQIWAAHRVPWVLALTTVKSHPGARPSA